MYEIKVSVQNASDLDNFLVKTGKFGKRFYTVERFVAGKFGPCIDVKAIAISRDMTYILTWHICCDRDHHDRWVKMLNEESISPEDFEKVELYLPQDEGERVMWFPLLGNACYVDVFEYNGFVLVDSIEKEG